MVRCSEDHFEGEDDCIECAYYDEGGNWKRWIICSWLGHSWGGVYSWWLHCDRCQMDRFREGVSLTPFGDGFLVG